MITQVLYNLSLLTFKPDEFIISQGEIATNIVFMCRGKCELLKQILHIKPVFIRKLAIGEMMGQFSVVLEAPSDCFIQSKNYSTLCGLSQKHIDKLL